MSASKAPRKSRGKGYVAKHPQVVEVDLTGRHVSEDAVKVLKLVLHWAGSEQRLRHFVATVRVNTEHGPVVREVHNRDGSWMTDRTAEDQWPPSVTMREVPVIAPALHVVLNRKPLCECIGRALQEAEWRARGWKWPTKAEAKRLRAVRRASEQKMRPARNGTKRAARSAARRKARQITGAVARAA